MAKNTDSTVSDVVITEELLPIYQQYVEAQKAKAAAEKTIDKLKTKIIAFHKEHGVARIKDKGFSSTLSEGCRETLLKDVIESKFGKLPPECIRTTIYDSIRVSGSLIAE
jgi:hypothetical protein